MCGVEVEGLQPGVADGHVDEGLVGVEAQGGCFGGRWCGAVTEGVGMEFGGRGRGGGGAARLVARREEEREGAGGGGVVCGGGDTESDAGELEEGL